MKDKDEQLGDLKLELVIQCAENESLIAQLKIAKNIITEQGDERKKRMDDLVIANIELAFQNSEKENRAAELVIASIELAIEGKEKAKRADELVLANIELAFQSEERGKRAAELAIANSELAQQNEREERRAEALVIANKELVIQNEEKEKRTAELLIANKELKQFAYIASHDLQEPLRTISNYMEAFEQEYFHCLDENAREYIRSIKGAATRMNLLVEALLDFSRIGRDKTLVVVDCKKIVGTVLEDLHHLIKRSKAIIEVSEMPVLRAYEIEIGQLFSNLITNAIKFQKKGVQPKIEITAIQDNGKWKFSICDNGIGIDHLHFDRVFDLFQRLHSHDRYAGNGIGLANCKKIVQLHGGEIWIASDPGQGSTFHFTISN